MQPLDVPERALQAFEKIHRLQVTVHDLRGSLATAINRERHAHRHALCRCVKTMAGERRCIAFEIFQLRANLHRIPEGRYHVCHAGLVEWVTPVYSDLELEWIIFAGVRSPGPGLRAASREPLTRWERSPWDARTALPPPVDDAEAGDILEHLRQVAARLQSWVREREKELSPVHREAIRGDTRLMKRRVLIRRFIEANQAREVRLRELAAELKVSEDRATHLVRECCGQTFRDMLIEARLKTVKELLRFSSLPVLEVALGSGFNEISHFNRLFRQREGCTPGQYRRDNGKQG